MPALPFRSLIAAHTQNLLLHKIYHPGGLRQTKSVTALCMNNW